MYMKVVIKLQSWSNLPGDGLRRHKQEHSASYCKRTRENILSGMSIGFEGDVSHIWMMGPNIIRTISAWWYCNLIARCSWTIRTVVFVTARALFLFGRRYVGLCGRLDFIIPNKPLTQFWYEIGVLVFFPTNWCSCSLYIWSTEIQCQEAQVPKVDLIHLRIIMRC